MNKLVSSSVLQLIAATLIALAAIRLFWLGTNSFGPQQDELIWWPLILHPEWARVGAPSFTGISLPVLEMSYLGNLKYYFYLLLPGEAQNNIVSIRLFTGLLALCGVWLVLITAKRLAGTAAALIVSALLICNPSFMMPRICDWGPMAVSSALFGLLLFLGLACQWSRYLRCFGFGFVCGLGLWDKLTFIFPMLVAVIASSYWRHFWSFEARENYRRCFYLTGGFLLGVSPLLWANFKDPLVSLSAQTTWDFASFPYKAGVLLATLDGSAIYGYLVQENDFGHLVWDTVSGYSSIGFFLLIFGLATASGSMFAKDTNVTVEIHRLSLVLFASAGMAWLCMASRTSLAYSVHHSGLLQLGPELATGLVLGPIFEKRSRLAFSLVVIMLLPTYRLGSSLEKFGPGRFWRPEVAKLAETLLEPSPCPTTALDWGIRVPLEYVSNGRLGVSEEIGHLDKLKRSSTGSSRCFVVSAETWLAQSDALPKPTEIVRSDVGQAVFVIWKF